ncbi:MAG TPA: hypothetical protein VNT79_02560 [Phycisphaerae bacterium]|nr:hypothetical protein [Phycisphaerae bacterium]
MSDRKIKRALIAVYDKTGIADFARALVDEFGIEIISTGGTAKHLKDAGIPVTLVEQVTGFPELLDGRVKTLHPKIHAAILADRDNPDHMRQLQEQGIEPIDMVVVNLYHFERTVADPNCTFEQAIEMIDIGGPCLLRAAAKNHKSVLLVTKPSGYAGVLHYLRESASYDLTAWAQSRREKASSTFWEISHYDSKVAAWLGRQEGQYSQELLAIYLERCDVTRYGENPHQSGRLFEIGPFKTIHYTNCRLRDAALRDGEMSFNNYLDADAALGVCSELARVRQHLWHRFSTGEGCDRFPTGRGMKQRITREHITRRNLPHLQKPASTYFVTFRVLHGQLSAQERDIALAACRFWHGKKMTLHNAVIMPDHVHLLLTPHEIEPNHWVNLGELLHSIKRHSSYEINKLRNIQGPLWQDETFDRLLRDEREFIEKWEYTEANPVTAGIAKREEKYPWFWRSDTGFQETVHLTTEQPSIGPSQESDRLETCRTPHRLETGATDSATKTAAVCLFIKHTNACGVGIATDPIEAYRDAYLGDPNAAMGGILACSFDIDPDSAAAVMETYDRFGKAAGAGGFFVEVWIAPSFDEKAVEIIRTKKKWGTNVRLLAVGDMTVAPDAEELDYKRITGGMLVQTRDLVGLNEDQWKVATRRQPTEPEMSDLRLAWLVAKHTKSNAISICKDGMLIGNGAGQMSRVMSCRIATWLAKENGHEEKLKGAAAASDAFFPFKDGPEILMDAGVTAIIQPGGSKRDEEVIAACDERGAAMVFTGTRHFKH